MNFKTKLQQIVASTKQGFMDIKLVLEDGQYKLFLKPLAVAIVLYLGYHYITGALAARDANIKGQIDAVHAQQNNEQEYMANKQKLLNLEPRFPDASNKNAWLLNQTRDQVKLVLGEEAKQLSTKIGPNQSEDNSNSGYTVVSVPVEVVTSYGNFGRLLASIEGREEFLKVSEFTLTKNTGSEGLGTNLIKMRVNTVFPAEKVADTLFKDKAKQGGKK